MNRTESSRCLLLAGAFCLATAARAQDDWTRNFRVGVQMGLNIRADFKTSGQLGISGSQPGPPGVTGVNHQYDNGYVRVDETGNAQGVTTYFGYQNQSQFDVDAQTLSFQSTKAFDSGSGSGHSESPVQLGFDMAYGGNIKRWWRKRLGWEFGVGILPISMKDKRNLSGNFTIGNYIHATNPFGPVDLPQAPYEGGPAGPAAVISDTQEALPDTSVPGTITGSRKLDLMFYNFRLGPTFYYDVHPRFAVSVSAGPAMGVLTGDYVFDETSILSTGGSTHSTGKFGKTDIVYGGYANALALVHILENGDLFAGVQFMSMGGSHFVKGGREAKLDLGAGFYFMAGVSWPF
jgi:hypothetical protein